MNRAGADGLRLGLIGDPVAHSASPALQRGFLREAKLRGSYEAICVPAGQGARAIDRLRAQGYLGLNVTTPLKEEAFARADVCDAAARASGAVNTLVLGERIAGYNTDGIGALLALGDLGLADPAGKRILVLGTGPTARAALAAFGVAGAAVFVWSRTTEKARVLAGAVRAGTFAPGAQFDAIFSALLPGVTLAAGPLREAALRVPLLLDANYGERATLALTLGRDGADGLGMLRHGAAAAFALWRAAVEALPA